MFIDAQKEILRLQCAQKEEDLEYKNSVNLEWDTIGDEGLLKSFVQNEDIFKVLKPLGFCAVIDKVIIKELGLYTIRAVMDSHVYQVKVWIVPK